MSAAEQVATFATFYAAREEEERERLRLQAITNLLTETEARLWAALALADGATVPHATLCRDGLGYQNATMGRHDLGSLKAHIYNIRRKLGTATIERTVGIGYRLADRNTARAGAGRE